MRKLMLFTIGFTVACILGSYFYSPWLALILFLTFVGFIVGLALKKLKTMALIAVVALGISTGLGWYFVYHHFYLAPAAGIDGSQLSTMAEISDYSTSWNYGVSAKGQILLDEKPYSVILYLKENRELKPGDRVSGTFRLRMTHEGLQGNTYHRGSGIFLLAYSQGKEQYQISNDHSWRHFPAILRRAISDRIELLFPDDTAFFAKALLIGDRSDVDYETSTAFKISGISHIIAVSGLHVSILYSVIFLISGRKRSVTAIIGIPTLILFATVTGFTPSVTRACVMQILFIIADLFLTDYDPPTSLSAAVLLMLLFNPVSVTSVSLQLSVGCMAGIFLFADKLRNWICNASFWKSWKGKSLKAKLRNWLASCVSVTLGSMFFTTPLVAVYFGSVSLVGVLTNLLTLLAVSWVFYGTMIVCVLSLVWHWGAMLVTWPVSLLIRYILILSKAISTIPLAAVYTKSRLIIAWIVICYLMIFVYLRCKRLKTVYLACAVTISLATALLLSWVLPLTAKNRITVLDVGQGQSILLQSGGKTFLVDCGGDDPENAADLAAETLLSMGIYRLDGVIVTHYDFDHVGGIPYLLSRISADCVFLPIPAENEAMQQRILDAAGNSAIMVQQDVYLSWDDTELSIFAPVFHSKDNESGLCVLFSGENCDILITGDLGISGENKLILNKEIPQLTVLVAGHHGSLYSTGEALLTMTKPQYIVISVGEDNRYDHPNRQLLERLNRFDCTVYRTDQDGTIVFRR